MVDYYMEMFAFETTPVLIMKKKNWFVVKDRLVGNHCISYVSKFVARIPY